MPTTPNFSFPYPAGADPADVPADLEALADAIDTLLNGNITAAMLAANSVGSSEIVDAAVTSQKLNITTYEDTQSSDVTGGASSQVLPGIDIAPTAGTYLAIASCEAFVWGAGTAKISIRVNGVNVIDGPRCAEPAGSDLRFPLVAHGVITVAAAQHVEVYGTLTGVVDWYRPGRLTLMRIA